MPRNGFHDLSRHHRWATDTLLAFCQSQDEAILLALVPGTIISLMIPYTLVVLLVWLVFFVVWYVIGIPLGPGYSVGTE